MNLGSIYGELDRVDRSIIITAWTHYRATYNRGIRLKERTAPTHNKVGFLNAVVVSKALRRELGRYDDINLNDVRIARRIKRMIKLVDGILK